MDIINDLYAKYMNDSKYVYYKECDTIIIMKKVTNDITCICNIEPKKYYSKFLKVILMFNLTDPYKLISDLQKYKINEIVESDYYDFIKEAYTLYQKYHKSGQKMVEWNSIDGLKNGLYQEYYESGKIHLICTYKSDLKIGLSKMYDTSGKYYLYI